MRQRRSRARLSRATLISLIGVGTLLVLAWIATMLIPNPAPATVEEATAVVTGYLDRVEETIPASATLGTSEKIVQGPCPIEDSGDRATVRRVINVESTLDRVAWAASLSEEFPEAEGWVVRVMTLGSRENLRIRVVGKSLIILNITAVGNDSGEARIIMTSASECSQP